MIDYQLPTINYQQCSVTGTAVTSEFYAYGVTTNGLKWTRVRYGRVDSPRFVTRYENGFGEIVREEKSGANGSTLVSERVYDAKGRLVSATATVQPTETREYDDLGILQNVTLAADGEWRSQSLSRIWKTPPLLPIAKSLIPGCDFSGCVKHEGGMDAIRKITPCR